MVDEPVEPRPPSFGNMSDRHWSRARRDSNQEALEYYRQRSKAPGVAGGGAERNFYCMSCDGVIAYESQAAACPHCGAAVEARVKRYFNWVEMNEPPRSELRALLPWALLVLVLFGSLVALALVWLF